MHSSFYKVNIVDKKSPKKKKEDKNGVKEICPPIIKFCPPYVICEDILLHAKNYKIVCYDI